MPKLPVELRLKVATFSMKQEEKNSCTKATPLSQSPFKWMDLSLTYKTFYANGVHYKLASCAD